MLLSQAAQLNPRLSEPLDDDDGISFVPMAALSAEEAKVDAAIDRPYVEVKKGYTCFESGDVLVAKITPCFENGKIAQANVPNKVGFGSTEFHVVRPRAGVSDGRYLHHYLRQPQVREAGKRRMTGSGGQRRVPENYLAGLSVPVPPVSEQRRIAAILDQADALRAQRRQALAELDKLAQAVFVEMFGDGRKNPRGWPLKPFGEVCETRLGKMLDQKQQSGEHLRPYLRNANVQWHRLDLDDVLEMDFDATARQVFQLRPGDLLICEGGEPGRAAIWRGEIGECYYQKALHRARPAFDVAIPEFVAWLLWFMSKTGALRDHITAATIAHLTGEKLRAMPIMLPPIQVQNAFATRLQAIESLKATHRAALAESDALFASLQHRAFSGAL